MDIEFIAYLEQMLDDHKTRIDALEKAVTQIPQINFETDISRPVVVRVEPAALPQPVVEAPIG